jgi:hypothetical protein
MLASVSSVPKSPPPGGIELFKCSRTQDITVRIGNATRTLTIGQWSKLIVHPIMVDPSPSAASET